MATGTADESESSGGSVVERYNRWVQSALRNPRKVYKAMFYVAMIFFLVTTLFPFYWLLVLSLTPYQEINDGITLWGGFLPVPEGLNFEAFIQVFQVVPFHHFIFNSFVIALSTTIIVVVIASLAGYVFGRLEFPGRTPLLLIVLAISYFPPAAFFLPLYKFFAGSMVFFGVSTPKLLNTPGALIPPMTAIYMPLSIFILTTFYRQIPDGLEDAARVEGTTRLGALFRVIMPLSAPGVATSAVLTFIYVYNEFFFSSLMITVKSADKWAVIVGGILSYQTRYVALYNLMAAASLIAVIPVAILVVIAQEKIVSGLTAGALKE
jgi:multiple sugar transport system permease protein